jgi:titin
LTATPGDGEVGLAWTPPISNGGSAVVDYVVQFKTAADAVWRSQTLGSDATFATVTGLDNGTAYTFRVAAVNGLGIGPWSAEAEATPDADQPKTPEAPTALTATPGDTVVGLTWTAPAPVAGVPVLDYAVSYKAATAATWRVTRTGADLAAYTVTGLTNGVAYDFKVAAINRVGVGQPSDTVTATPDAALARNPGVPTGLTATPGDREVGLRWTAPADNGGAPVTKYAVAYRPVEEATWSTFETDSPLTRAVVRSLANGFAYQFKVAAYNAIGVGPWSAAVEATPDETAGQSPSAPLALRAAAGNGEVGLAWLAPASDGGNPVTDYVIQYKTADEAVWSHSLELGSNATVATIKDLANGTVYAFRVAAVNAIGVGPWSNEATAAPDASLANTPGQPTAVTPTAGNTQVGLTWTAPADDGGSPVTDYVVQHRADGDATWQSALIGSTATRYTVKDLRNGVAYAFRVAAVNAIGAGDWSELARATPTASGFRAPGPPTNLTATPGDTQIGLTWTPPSDNGGTPVTQYAVAYRTSPDGVWQVVETGSPDWQHTLKGLVNGQAYDVMVAAVNRLGQGDWSTMVTSVTPAAGLGRAPLAPTAEARAGDSAVVLSWTPAPVEPGSEVTSYVVDYREAGEFWLTTATTERELVFDDLANGTVYEFRVAGVNRIGRGDWSNVVEATPQAGLGRLPGAPSGLEARPGNAQVGLSWTAPADDGGSAIQRYRIEYWTDGAAPVMVTLDSDQTRATVKGLVNDIAYSFRVAAVNGFGRGPWTATAEATPSASLPSSPSAPTALRATPGDKAVGLVWQPPQNDGGSRVVDYLVSYRACGDDCATASSTWTTVDLLSNATAYTVTGLVNGSLYEFRVAAVNAIGPGDWSTAVTAAPQAGLQAPPEAPRDLTATPGDTEVGLTWTPTGPADDYMVQYQPVGQALWQSVTLGSDATFATIRQLVNGTRYAFRVAAVNGVGVGAWSNTAEATPDGTRARTPDAPTGLTAVAGNTVVGLSWTAPANDGGAAVVDYAVSYRPSAQTGWTVVRIGSDYTAYTVMVLTNGTRYSFRVAAFNVVGVGVDSSVVQARPDSSLAKTPDVPTGLTAGAGDAQVGLRWTPPAFDGGSPVTKYAIAYRPVGAATWKTQMTADIEPWATVDGLFNGMRYEFKVAAYNAIGLGDWSAPAAATPKAGAGRVPDAPTGLVATPGDNEVGLKWTAPNDNGSKITAYVVAYKAKADAVWLYVNLPSDATRTTIRELANRRAFDFKVAAVNGIGTGPWSAPASATTDGSYGKTPAAPVDLAAKPGDRVVGLSWTAPVDTGGSPIESYVVFYRPVGGGLWSAMETESQVTIASVKGLTNGVEYEFKVAAVNGIGLGLDSDVVKATPDAKYGGVPTAPRDVQVTPGSTVLLVTWAPPAAAGLSGVQSYLVEYREQGSTSWIPVMTAGTQTQLRLSNLVNGQPYEVRVTAVNSVGPGEPSDVVVATPTYGPVVWTSPEALRPGETLTIHGRGFNPQEVLTVEVRSDYVPLGVHTADDGGNVSFAWTLPEDFAVGTHNAVVTDAQGTEFRAQFTVLADEIVPTGANTAWPMAAAAGGALLLGAVFLGYAWRRRQVERGIDLGRRAFV